MGQPNRFLGKSELAASWGISISTLYTWLNSHTELMIALKALGYNPRQKLFTPKQLAVIYSFFGE